MSEIGSVMNDDAGPRPGQQVIDVVLPTYIMSPEENEMLVGTQPVVVVVVVVVVVGGCVAKRGGTYHYFGRGCGHGRGHGRAGSCVERCRLSHVLPPSHLFTPPHLPL